MEHTPDMSPLEMLVYKKVVGFVNKHFEITI